MPKFNDLPQEAMLHTMFFLDKKSLHSLAGVTKKIYELATEAKRIPVKYSDDIEVILSNHPYLKPSAAALFVYAQAGDSERLSAILEEEKKMDVNVKLYFDEVGGTFITPINLAARADSIACVEILLAKGASYKVTSFQGHYVSPLCYAAAGGSAACVKYFLEHGVPVDQQTPIACPLGWNWTALQVAASRGNENCVALLIDKKADVNKKDPDEYQAIHRACAGGYSGCLKLLLDHGADPNATNEDSITPLLMAVNEGGRTDEVSLKEDYHKCTELLLQKGASTAIRSIIYHRFRNVLDLARELDDQKAVELLNKYTKQVAEAKEEKPASVVAKS